MLRRFTLAVAFLGLAYAGHAQTEFRKFRVDVGLGYAIPKGGGGIIFAVEPKYSVIPNKLSAGLKFESAAMAKEVNGENAKIAGTVSYTLTGDYHFTQTTARPFAGAGFGYYKMASAGISNGSTTSEAVSSSSGVGGLLRAGLDVAHMRFALEYNMIPKSEATVIDVTSGNSSKIDVKNSYMGVKFSAYIGGGKKK